MHCLLVTQIFCYFAYTLDLKIMFKANSSNELVSYSDSEYANLVDGRKSIGRYIFILSSGPLSH